MKKQITFRTTNNLWSKFKAQTIVDQNDVEYDFDQELEFLKLRTNFHSRIEHSDINSQLISQVQFNNNKRSEKSTYDKSLNLKFKLFERSILIEYLKTRSSNFQFAIDLDSPSIKDTPYTSSRSLLKYLLVFGFSLFSFQLYTWPL